MSVVIMNECDNCKKRVQDRHAEIGWISIDAGLFSNPEAIKFTVFNGRDERGMAKTLSYKLVKQPEFCSINCFVQWLSRPEKVIA
jgi:hypothetical protein